MVFAVILSKVALYKIKEYEIKGNALFATKTALGQRPSIMLINPKPNITLAQ